MNKNMNKPATFSIDSIYCITQYVNSIIYKIIGIKCINFPFDFTVYFNVLLLSISEKH